VSGVKAAGLTLGQPPPIASEGLVVGQVNAIDEGPLKGAGGLGETVMHPEAVLPTDDEPRLPEIRQVPRHGGLRQVQSPVQVANAHFATFPQQVEQAEPHGVRQRLKEMGGAFQRLDGGFLHTLRRI
jgi:hypothetical protein